MTHHPPHIPEQLNDYFKKEHANRVSDGMFDKVRHGDFPGCPPVGYRNARYSFESAIIVDEKLAPLVQKAFYLAAEGKLSLRKILKIVTDEGLVSRNGKPMGVSAFWNMLRNPFYTGRIRYQGGLAPGNHRALVDEEVFVDVVEILRANRKH